jgi:YtxH-like protein
MEISDHFARHIPSTDEILRSIGLQVRQSRSVAPSVALFGAGLLVGAGLALLFTPSNGRELREEIGGRAASLRERVGASANKVVEEADKTTRRVAS